MKACLACGRLYPPEAGFCPVDGSALTSATQAPPVGDADDPHLGALLFDRYQIRRVVADGGMGRVYEALDLQARRNVAIKRLHPEVARDRVAVERFKREYEVSQLLPHDHIVEVLDFRATRDGSYALVMEFLYGEELRATLKRDAVLSPARLIRMVSQVALGLDQAHALALVHRDLKPDNIFLCQTPDGDIVKVLDFGSVKDKAEGAKKLTMLGTTIGSPYYMSPEQAQSLDGLDHRADVWAMAAILYECVTGKVPFNGINGPSILLEILMKEPVQASLAAAGMPHPVPAAMDRAIAHGLRKSPALRPSSVGALADEVGHAYGLAGDQRAWAAATEAEVDAEVVARGALVMVEPAAPSDDPSDNFFGETDALGVADGPSAAAHAGAASASTWAPLSEPAFSVPTRSSGWGVLVLVILVALTAGVGLAALLR